MKDYKVIKPVIIPCGVVRLEDDQAAPRMEYLTKKTKGVYETSAPQGFKAGEVIGLESVSKSLLCNLEEIKKPVSKK